MRSVAAALAVSFTLLVGGCGQDRVQPDGGGRDDVARDRGPADDTGREDGGGEDGPGQADAEPDALTPDGGGTDGPGGDAIVGGDCPVTPTGRSVLQEIVHETLMSAVHVAANTHLQERGFALTLTGVEEGFIAFASVISACTEKVSYEPYCDPTEPGTFWAEKLRCSRLRCEGPGIALTDIWFTEAPEMSPDVPHPFEYTTVSPPGTARYEPNPSITYRIDQTASLDQVATADISVGLSLTPEGEAPLALSHGGTVEVTTTGPEEVSGVTLSLIFPDLAKEGALELDVTLTHEQDASGELRIGDQVLATISGRFAFDMPVTFAWQDGCNL